jgi:hypothetical protein
MGMKGNGLTAISNLAKPILGYTDQETVKLDFDDLAFHDVKGWAMKTLHKFRLRGFLLLKSSPQSYHVVFDRAVSWLENLRIMAWIAIVSRHEQLQKYTLMQCIKQSSTLRVSAKSGKPAPRIVYRYGEQDAQIRHFTQYRLMITRMLKNDYYIQ